MRHEIREWIERGAREGRTVVLSAEDAEALAEDLRALDDARNLAHRLSVRLEGEREKCARAIADRNDALQARDEWVKRFNASAAEVQDTRRKAHEDSMAAREALTEKDAKIADLTAEVESLSEHADARSRAEIQERQLTEERALRRAVESEMGAAYKSRDMWANEARLRLQERDALQRRLDEERQNAGARLAEKDAEIARLRARPPSLPYFRCAAYSVDALPFDHKTKAPLDTESLDFSRFIGIADGVLLAALRKVLEGGRPAVLPVRTAAILADYLVERDALASAVRRARVALEPGTNR